VPEPFNDASRPEAFFAHSTAPAPPPATSLPTLPMLPTRTPPSLLKPGTSGACRGSKLWQRRGAITFVKSLHCADHHPIRIGDERMRLVTASPVITKSRAPAGGSNHPENGLVKSPRRDTRAVGPAGKFGGKAPHRLAAEKSRLHAPSLPMRNAPVYFLCKWGV
jgi:hypothetical protein